MFTDNLALWPRFNQVLTRWWQQIVTFECADETVPAYFGVRSRSLIPEKARRF